MAFTITVNGKAYTLSPEVTAASTLQLVLRDDLGLTGTKFGCGQNQCGACTVHMDGAAVRSCQVSIADAVGKQITTIEGLARNGKLHPVQQAWVDVQVPQCGYCQSGQIMEAAAFLKTTPHPTEAQVRQAMSGHICRCGTYNRITAAVLKAAG
ncbi:MAG: (2Fe-2S)-binding protein [Chloroflexota bacterium]